MSTLAYLLINSHTPVWFYLNKVISLSTEKKNIDVFVKWSYLSANDLWLQKEPIFEK